MKNKIKNTVNESRNKLPGTNETAESVKINRAMSGSDARKSLLLNKLATQHKIKEIYDNREYRLITGSDDGYILFWNIPHNLVTEAQSRIKNLSSNSKLGSKKYGYKIPELKPKNELLLSGYA